MKRFSGLIFVSLLLLSALTAPARAQKTSKRTQSSSEINPILKEVDFTQLDLMQAQWKRVQMPFEQQGLSSRQVQMVKKLVEASHYIEDIFLRQSDPEVVGIIESLRGSGNSQEQQVLRMVRIMGSRFDLLRENKPFIGSQPMFAGRGYYPSGLTQEEVDAYVLQHPQKKDEIYSQFTIVRRNGDGLMGVPYRVAYQQFLEPAAKALREAADLSDDAAFANFLRLRADALLSDDYYKSDVAWVDLKDPKIDIILAPYETYTDGLLGVKASYGASLLIRDEVQSQKLAVFQKYVPEIQEALPLDKPDLPSKRGQPTPMEVMNAPFRAGDLRHEYQAVADNLPNDPRIHEEKGTKKIFFKNFMDARVNYVILPIAKVLMQSDQAARASGDGYLASTMMHEICHGLGPAFSRVNGKQVPIREALGPLYGGLEEAKADVVGMYALNWLIEHGALPKERLQEYYASYVAGLFRTVRFSIAEAHGRAEMMEFNYLSEQKAITRKSGRYVIDYQRLPGALASLAKELLEMEASGDRARAESWFGKYQAMPSELQSALQAVKNVPVDIEPVFSFPEPIE